MKLPNIPERGSRAIPQSYFRELHNFIRAITPCPSNDIKITTTANGTCYNLFRTVDDGGGDGSLVHVKITGNASGGGQYTGRILTGTSTADGAGNLALPEGQLVPAADDALILNADEDGQGTHWLLAGTFSVGALVGYTDDATPLAIIVIPRGVSRIADYDSVPQASTDAADTTTWNRVTDDDPLLLTLMTRVKFASDGTKLYGYTRAFTFDESGRLHNVSAETRVDIATTEETDVVPCA
jgi:hypothetical protein